jgi:hypothetical protein
MFWWHNRWQSFDAQTNKMGDDVGALEKDF